MTKADAEFVGHVVKTTTYVGASMDVIDFWLGEYKAGRIGREQLEKHWYTFYKLACKILEEGPESIEND